MRQMTAKFGGKCAGGCGVRIQAGDQILWSKESGAMHALTGCSDRYWGNEFGRYEAEQERRAYEAEMDWEAEQLRRDEAAVRQGAAEVAQIQAFTTAGSALREQMYLDAEMFAFNHGLD